MIKYIVKWEKDHPILFFPDYPANPGRIACYARVGQHGEACLQYYWSLRNPKPHQEADVAALVREYEQIGEPEPMKRVHRRASCRSK